MYTYVCTLHIFQSHRALVVLFFRKFFPIAKFFFFFWNWLYFPRWIFYSFFFFFWYIFSCLDLIFKCGVWIWILNFKFIFFKLEFFEFGIFVFESLVCSCGSLLRFMIYFSPFLRIFYSSLIFFSVLVSWISNAKFV